MISSGSSYTLPMSRTIFECFLKDSKNAEDAIKLEGASGILDNIEDINDDSDEFPEVIRDALIFLQVCSRREVLSNVT